MTFKSCLKSMRLRTLPLSLSGIVAGVALARGADGVQFSLLTLFFLFLTTALLQVLSNLSNELGDTLHGTDTSERQGIHYSVQDGEMTVAELKRLIRSTAVCCCVSGVLMIRFSFGSFIGVEQGILLLLGVSAIVAAMRYTLGKNPYGYRGLGDLFVFIFFGLVSTVGGYYICTHKLDLNPLLPACAIGCFSIGVLNVNNIRDMKTDMANRTTVAIKLGLKGARIYQSVLILSGWGFILLDTLLHAGSWQCWLCFMTLPLFILHLKGVWSRSERALDPMLPLLVMSTFALSLLMLLFR